MADRICHACGHGMIHDVRPLTITYKGLSATFDVPGWYCTSCDEAVFSGKDLAMYDQELNKMKAQSENLLLPNDIRRIRKKLHLTQADAGAILGGGPNAFHKYESGIVLPSHAISNLLRLLEAMPSGLDVLHGQNGSASNANGRRKRSSAAPDEPVAVAAG
jgi:HTH-type transcriptional regulator/antitoxin MqsA